MNLRQRVINMLVKDREEAEMYGESSVADAAIEGCCQIAEHIADLLDDITCVAFGYNDGKGAIVLRRGERRVDLTVEPDGNHFHITALDAKWEAHNYKSIRDREAMRQWAEWVKGDQL